MRDERKTKKQLIAELEALRQQRAVERASERIREEVLAMRTSDDLLQIVFTMFREIRKLDMPAVACSFHFVDGEADSIRCYVVGDHPDKHGVSVPISVLSGGIVEIEDFSYGEVVVDGDIIGGVSEGSISAFLSLVSSVPADLVERWRSGEVWSHREVASETAYMKRVLGKYPEMEKYPFYQDGIVTHVPFLHGTVSIKEKEGDFSQEHVSTVQTLTEALSLGYLRFLDFQRLEQQAEQARRERAVERVRAEAMAMRKSGDLLKVVIVLHQEMLQLGVESGGCNIAFMDAENNRLRNYVTHTHPLFMELPDREVVDGNRTVCMEESPLDDERSKVMTMAWRERKVDTSLCSISWSFYSGAREFKGDLSQYDITPIMGEFHVTNVPFEYGVIGFTERVFEEDSVTIVQELAEALSFGCLRFLDFQKVDEAQKRLIDELEEELQTAHDLQMGLMPKGPPQIDGFDIAGRCIPANHVGGDFFQYFERDGKLAVCMADVTGHAMEAAVPVMMFSGVLKSQMELNPPMEALFGRLNRTMHDSLDSRTYVCFCMGELDVADRRFRLANAACPYPFHFQAATGEVEEMQVDAYPLGVRDGTAYTAIETALEPGDRIIFCSDGIIEAGNEREEIFGFDQTREIIRRGCNEGLSSEALIDRVLSAVKTFSGEAPQGDDQTMVVMVRVD